MQTSFKILFHENGDPIDHLCIKRFIVSFPERYHEVVDKIIKNSATLDEQVFKINVATLMPTFKMTRRGAFRGVKINEKGILSDPKGVIDRCWRQIGRELTELKRYIDEKAPITRKRVIVDLSSASQDYIIEKTSELFDELRKVKIGTTEVSPVGASKVLFATLPEIALPVDNAEWKVLFRTEEYREILSKMVSEIAEWERKTTKHLDELDPKLTLPGIYNIMAMAARRLER